MCETDHNNKTFTIVEQKIALENLEAYLRYTDFLKTANLRHYEHFTAIEKFEKINFTANYCEYVLNWSQQHELHRC